MSSVSSVSGMTAEHSSCLAVFGTNPLSSAAMAKIQILHATGSIDWNALWPLLLQYGQLAIQALEEVLPLVGVGTPWITILTMIQAALKKLTGG